MGIVARSRESVKELENDPRVKAQMDGGLTVINLTSEKILWTTCSEIRKKRLIHGNKIISFGFKISEEDMYKERLQYLARDETSSINSFKNFFMNGLSPKESVTPNFIKKSMANRLSQLSGLLSKHNEGWPLFVSKDVSNNAHFAPRKFYAPLRSVIEFQRMFSQTQVLSCYFEERKKIYLETDKDKRFSLFIAD